MPARRLVHCSYHKCLTAYFARVMHGFFQSLKAGHRGYCHFNSNLRRFHEELDRSLITSVNNHCLDLDRLGDFRLTRFLRDPRDLVVSGYHYHRRGAEEWCNLPHPTEADWEEVNGARPEGMPQGRSFARSLQDLPFEEGLMAEIEFRRHHFDSMTAWPANDPRILVFRYEDVLGHEEEVFRRIFEFYGFPPAAAARAGELARRFAVRDPAGHGAHVRDPTPGQGRARFTPRVRDFLEHRHPGLLAHLGYAAAVGVS